MHDYFVEYEDMRNQRNHYAKRCKKLNSDLIKFKREYSLYNQTRVNEKLRRIIEAQSEMIEELQLNKIKLETELSKIKGE